ncbi:hypothetical protein V3C99_012981 [Haemonchus contortus]
MSGCLYINGQYESNVYVCNCMCMCIVDSRQVSLNRALLAVISEHCVCECEASRASVFSKHQHQHLSSHTC